MASRARNLSGLMGTSSTLDINDIANLGDLTGVDSYADSDALALAVVPIGTQAYQTDTGSFKIYRGASGWAQMDEFPTAPSWVFQGTVSGYTSGGVTDDGATYLDTIDKFPFAADANATDVGDLTRARIGGAGQSSPVSGYTSGGLAPWQQFTPANTNIIDKFPFAADGNATDVGDLTTARDRAAGQSSSESGYASGGAEPAIVNTIDKFPFASDGNATDVADLSQGRKDAAGQSSGTFGYVSGGAPAAGVVGTTIDKFPFAADANATDVGDLTQGIYGNTGQSSAESGYVSGGWYPLTNVIEKFPFASDANATDVGDLTQARRNPAGQSSDASGYTSGGFVPPQVNTIDKFPFAADANATDVGDLTQARFIQTGQQV